ncbi:MAG: C25 family cysteine peptidase, partial [bacterium]
MKGKLLLFVVILGLLSLSQIGIAAWTALDSGGKTPLLRLESANETGILLYFEFSGFETETVILAGREFQKPRFEDYGSWGELGRPELPVLRRLVRLPEQSGWQWSIVSADFVELPGYTLSPLQEEPIESPDGIITSEDRYDVEAYSQDLWFPEQPIELKRPIILRGHRLGQLEIRPLLYNPAQGLLRAYRSLTIKITFAGQGENPVERVHERKSRLFSSFVQQNVINPELDELDEGDEVLGGYLFITPPNLQSTLDSYLVSWKRQKGFPCTVMTTTQAGGTAAAIRATIQNIYNTWPIPPDYLVIVGDEDYGFPTNYYDGWATDLPYTLLEGTDYFPDMLVGRLSVDSSTDLAVLCNKIKSYESTPYMTSTSWFTRALLVYDYSGSYSCRTTKERCGDLMAADGYAIERVTCPPYYSGAAYINPIINNGVTFVNYRGYGSYTNWTPPNYSNSNISSLSNGFKLPVVTSIVCGGGNFAASSDPCFGEAWTRYGSVSNPIGAVSFVGPSCLYTHTRWNNCLDAGIYQGIFAEDIYDLGSAFLRGKMELYEGMPNNQGPGGSTNSVEFYFHTYNILGDPGLEMWTGVPATLSVSHPTSLAQGVNAFNLTVTTGGSAVEDALVCVYNATAAYQLTDWTDANGCVLLNLEDAPTGSYTVTVTGHNLLTYLGALSISQQAVALGIDSLIVDDDMSGESSGDGDGEFNPGETIELAVMLKNTGSSQSATVVGGTVSSTDPYLTIIQNILTGPNLAP